LDKDKQSIWDEANQRYLLAALNIVKVELEFYLSKTSQDNSYDYDKQCVAASGNLESAFNDMPFPAALDRLCAIFGLSRFERNMLLLAAGIELDSEIAGLVATIQGEKASSLPTFSMALAILPEAHWTAITPNAPLRYWHLIEVYTQQSVTKSTFSIDEQILNYLVGLPHLNESLFGIADPYLNQTDLVPSQMELVNQIGDIISHYDNKCYPPVIELFGEDIQDKLNAISKVCRNVGLVPYTMSVTSIPDSIKEIMDLSRLWNRESFLGSAVLFLDCSEVETNDIVRLQKIARFCEKITGFLFLGCRYSSPVLNRHKYIFNVYKPSTNEQLILWQNELKENKAKLDGHLPRIVSQFSLSAQAIREVSAEVMKEKAGCTKDIGQIIWKLCCLQSRPRLEELAQRIEPVADWDDIVLPEIQKQTLYEIASQVKQRVKVYEEWGFARKCSRGLGISVLFTGESGTGKTMAAEILAKALQLDLYRIDLSQVVNKYIGETEKNLKKVFDAAETGCAVLLFDEADALFGKRSEVRDSHDRYANIEVSYLLQRMEAYRGLAILTTNLKTAMDNAFLRRIRFIVQFPFPDAEKRAEIWRKIFPQSAPLQDIDINKLSRLNITGGSIRNIAVNAAFLAADNNSPIRMEYIEKAARYEYAKLEKPMSMSEKSTW